MTSSLLLLCWWWWWWREVFLHSDRDDCLFVAFADVHRSPRCTKPKQFVEDLNSRSRSFYFENIVDGDRGRIDNEMSKCKTKSSSSIVARTRNGDLSRFLHRTEKRQSEKKKNRFRFVFYASTNLIDQDESME